MACLILLLAACASGKVGGDVDAADPVVIDAATVVPDAAVPDAMGPVASACPADQFATGFDVDSVLQCAPIDAAARAAIDQHCSVYLGWNDSCDGCTTPPSKWGWASGTTCAAGAGADNTCRVPTLGGIDVPLFGLNSDGDVNDDDKFHAGLHCATPADEPSNGPCPDGTFMSGVALKGPQCVTAQGAIVDYMRNHCSLYFGWRDNCDGCTSAPSKWGRVDSTSCTLGTGVDSTCSTPTLGGLPVHLLGLNTDGNVNDDDKFYVGLQCTGAMPAGGAVDTICPDGELVVAIDGDGRVQCASPVPTIEAAVQAGCYVYAGWRDSCNGCTNPPSKWGRVSHQSCENGVGVNNTCATTPLDGAAIPLLGINTDGDVDGDDKFYLGLRCP